MQLNERIAQARKQAGLTQEQLGEALGVSRQAVSKWESGQANPDVNYIVEMCRLFGVSSDWLLLGKEGGGTEPVRCADCGVMLSEGAEFCHKCGARLDGNGREGRHCLYLLSNDEFSWAIALQVERLFAHPWAKPAFPWEGGPIEARTALTIIGSAPMVLCQGLTREQAEQGAALFSQYRDLVKIYREDDLVENDEGNPRPAGERAEVPVSEPAREPLSGCAIFGLVVLGVIAAILIMSVL